MKTAVREKRLFAEILIREGMASTDRVKRAIQIQKRTGEMLEEVLVEEGDLTEWDIARILVKHYKLPFLPLSRYTISKEALSIFPVGLLREHTMMPMDRFGKIVTIAIARNPEPGLKDLIQKDFDVSPSFFVSTLTDVKNTLNLHFPTPFSEFDGLLTDVKKSFQGIEDWNLRNDSASPQDRNGPKRD